MSMTSRHSASIMMDALISKRYSTKLNYEDQCPRAKAGATGARLGTGHTDTPKSVGSDSVDGVRTVKIHCPEDLAQQRRDYFLAFQVRNRGKPVRYNIKLEQEGSACYTPYR